MIRATIICGDKGAGKTFQGNSLFLRHRGPRLKTFCDTNAKAVKEWPNKDRTLLWVDDAHSVVNTIKSAYALGYNNLIICTQADESHVRRVVEAYGMPKGVYYTVPLHVTTVGLQVKELIKTNMMSRKKISIRYFLQKRLKSKVVDGMELYRVYVQIGFNRSNTQFPFPYKLIGDYSDGYISESSFELYFNDRRDGYVNKAIDTLEGLIFNTIKEGYNRHGDKFKLSAVTMRVND